MVAHQVMRIAPRRLSYWRPCCLIPSLLVCAIPHAACSQTFLGVSAGTGFAGPGATTPGFLAQVAVGQLGAVDGWRLDAFFTGGFEVSRSVVPNPYCLALGPNGTCSSFCIASGPNGPGPCGPPATISYSTKVGTAGLALSDVLPLHHSANGVMTYALVGVEMDQLTGGQGAPRNLLFGWSPGLGFAFAPVGRRRTVVEARFHGIVDSGGLPSWTLLLSVGMQWSLSGP